MKKYLIFSLAAAIFLCTALAGAAGGDASDPIISLSYLKDKFTAAFDELVDGALVHADESLSSDVDIALEKAAAASNVSHAESYVDMRLDGGDILCVFEGASVIIYAGDVTASFTAGTLIDVTDGSELASGEQLVPMHRYLASEGADASLCAASKTAALTLCGPYTLVNGGGTDYTAMADALRTLSLFKGSDTAYGKGYDLEKESTRVQALIMLIRLLGEEDEALACTEPSPFADMKKSNNAWAEPYVAYAYSKGYTNGVSATEFAPAATVNAQQYVEFVLRALGYSSTENTDVSTSPARALEAGVLTQGECSALTGGAAFLRADVVYLSYYALDTKIAQSEQRLHEKLSAAGIFDAESYTTACAHVTSSRIS
ncbi:MAG: S-layer homology domain-containing protein [Oscillospiraceae bacterium]|nr:S-layer homology domain-containing protein [Oscillospiraceae bacterium]